ncbi:flotillin domain-containing protein [Iodidimonas sp. SYSU 1G8]|uniref:flotillin family protein n=1 Tax=Iodidimonas sp. SYSU 1G8 TaxID=3133967 RepID=UPI0031FEAA49
MNFEDGVGLMTIIFIALAIIIGLFAVGLIFSRLYRRASKEVSFVRTGFGGQKVILNGGALVLPVLHEIIWVNMNTLRLAVNRATDQALITRDRMRVDVVAEFYVRVQPSVESIAAAAQTLGQRTLMPDQLKDLVEGKFVDALRSVAAEMTMTELHEQRTNFVQKVQQAVTEDLLKNGLELESVSLTGLDQTSREFFNPDNAFDAEGLTRLTDEIERRKKIRNDIEQDTSVQIENKNLETEKLKLSILRDQEYARMEQQREIEIRRAQQATEIAREQASKEQEAEQARIVAKQQVEASKITAERALEEQRITKERQIREREIEKERTIETQEVERKKTVELAEQDRAIAIAERSKAQSESATEADFARAKAVQAAEQVITARETEIASRDKQIDLIEAAKQAETEAIAVRVSAEAEKLAAADRAEAVREQARAHADQIKINAEAEAEAQKARAAAAEITYRVDAEGKRAINEAANMLSAEQVAMQIRIKLIEHLDQIIRESVKPMENIDSIKIIQVDGITGAGGGGGHDGNGGQTDGNLADQMVSGALRYRAQAPLVDSLLGELGIDGKTLAGLAQPAQLDKKNGAA